MYLYATLVPRDALAVLSYLASYVLETLAKNNQISISYSALIYFPT